MQQSNRWEHDIDHQQLGSSDPITCRAAMASTHHLAADPPLDLNVVSWEQHEVR